MTWTGAEQRKRNCYADLYPIYIRYEFCMSKHYVTEFYGKYRFNDNSFMYKVKVYAWLEIYFDKTVNITSMIVFCLMDYPISEIGSNEMEKSQIEALQLQILT